MGSKSGKSRSGRVAKDETSIKPFGVSKDQEHGEALSKSELRHALVKAQLAMHETANNAVLIICAGLDGVGKGTAVNLLNAWLDPRLIDTHGMHLSGEDDERPFMFRFWRRMPARGRSAIFFGSWYAPMFFPDQHRLRETRFADVAQASSAAVRFEQMLQLEGVSILKLWLHLSAEQQEARLADLNRDASTRWRVSSNDWSHLERHPELSAQAQDVMQMTSSAVAPWFLIPAAQPDVRDSLVAHAVLGAFQRSLAVRDDPHVGERISAPVTESDDVSAAKSGLICAPRAVQTGAIANEFRATLRRDEARVAARQIYPYEVEESRFAVRSADQEGACRIAAQVGALASGSEKDTSEKLAKRDYEERLLQLQGQINRAFRRPQFADERSLVAVFEGVDAAGKGGAIRRLTAALDARQYRVVRIAAPNDEERARPYLWRFWRHLPRLGSASLFDRSWYGRVLVERVEQFAQPNAWQRAYEEICEFENEMSERGIVVVKFWLQIDAQEQLQRFKDRERTPHKQHKITEEDWRNRARWSDYVTAATDMIRHTHTPFAPWNVVHANNKRQARLDVLQTIASRIKAEP